MLVELLGPAYGKSFGGRNYRGVDRKSIPYLDPAEDEAAGKIFDEYVELHDEHFELHDVDFCRRAVEVYRQLNPPRELEAVEITMGREPPSTISSQFLGFDVACARHISLLPPNVKMDASAKGLPDDDPLFKLAPLLELISRYFYPQLNENGLFVDYDTAAFYLETTMAVQKFRPNLWEGEHCKFEVIGVWHVA